MKFMKKIILLMILFGFAAVPAKADLIYNTGVDNSGTKLATLAEDIHYSLTFGGNAFDAVALANSDKPSAWVKAPDDSQWITGTNAGVLMQNIGDYSFTTTIDLTGYSGNYKITGNWATDNSGKIFLNGSYTGIDRDFGTPGDYGFSDLEYFEISGLIGGQENTLEFRVHNGDATYGGPMGLLVSNLSVVPLPATILLGFLGLGVGGWKLRKSI